MEELKNKLDEMFCEVDRHYYSGVIEPLAGKELLKMIQQAIDYIPCCKSESEQLSCGCPICGKEMNSQLVKHHHCKECKEHFTTT